MVKSGYTDFRKRLKGKRGCLFMKHKFFQRITAGILAAALTVSAFPLDAPAEAPDGMKKYEPTERSVSITAESDTAVSVREREESFEERDGLLEIGADPFTIARDYEQECMIPVTNISDETLQFYLEAKNKFEDISLEIIQNGAKGSPAVLMPGESAEIELSVFAQNARQEKYTVPLSVYVWKDGEYIRDAQRSVVLNCPLPTLNLDWTKISEDGSTLRQKYSVRNAGDPLTDVEIAASDTLAEYLSFDPVVSNYEMQTGDVVEFTVQPDLAKMKAEGVGRLTGSLVASCAGKTSTFDCTFDTKGQEITVTSMGELALKQNGNPFTKFEIIEDSVVTEYFDEQNYVKADQTEDFFDADDAVHMRNTMQADVGRDRPMDISMELCSSVPVEDGAAVDTKPTAALLADGTLRVTVKTVVTEAEYQEYISKARNGSSSGSGKAARAYAAQNDFEEGERRVLEFTFDVNDVLDLADMGSDAISDIGFIYDFCTVIEDTADTISVFSDPTIPQENKMMYGMLTMSSFLLMDTKYLLDTACPGAGFIFDLFTRPWQKEIDKMKERLVNTGGDSAAAYLELLGRQCTNRGSVAASFYLPDYAVKGNKKPSMYATNRLYADGYVDKKDTNYSVILNARPAASVQIPGLTQTVITGIPTDNLKPGEKNTLVFDYDTNPGSHYVNTDTRITFLYPWDTQIAYIGTPDTLQEVRALPDFAVYPENIYTESELIEGEETELRFHVYNLGSRGGWFTVVAHDGEKEIFRKENYYLAAFSSQTFAASWTPDSAGSGIRISLENTTIDTDELSTENNTASKKLTIRQRQVPVIGKLGYGTIYENSPYSLVLDVTDSADVMDLSFTVDGLDVPHNKDVSASGNRKRYLLTVDKGLETGEHPVRVSVKYATVDGSKTESKDFLVPVEEKRVVVPRAYGYPGGQMLYHGSFDFTVADIENLIRTELVLDNRQILEPELKNSTADTKVYGTDAAELGTGSHLVTIKMYYSGKNGRTLYEECSTNITVIPEDDSYFTFSLAKSITEPVFYIFDGTDYTELSCELLENREYRFKKTLDMNNNPENYRFLIQYDSGTGLLVQDILKNHLQITAESSRTVTFEKRKAAKNAVITRIEVQKAGDAYVYFELPAAESVSLLPGAYVLSVSGYVGSEQFNRSVEVDMTQGNQTVALDEFVLSYYFKMEGTDTTEWKARISYRNQGSTYWDSEELSTLFDVGTGILKCYTSDTSVAEQADAAVLVIYSDSEVFTVPVEGLAAASSRSMEMDEIVGDPAVLSRQSLNKVTLLCEADGLAVTRVSVDTDTYNVYLSSAVMYLPDDRYALEAVVSTGYQSITVDWEDDIKEETELIVDRKISRDLKDLKISWPGRFQEAAAVFAQMASGKQISAYAFASGGVLKTEPGQQELSLLLEQEDYRYTIQKSMDVGNDGAEVRVGDSFMGKLRYSAGANGYANEKVSFSVSDMQDEYGNELVSFRSDLNLFKGTATFVDVKNEDRKFVSPAMAASEYRVEAALPPEAGTYRISVELYSYVKEDQHQHTITTDAAKAATCTQNGLTEGSHCEVCGEILVKQTVIPARGHQFKTVKTDATCKTEGSVFDRCTVCGQIRDGSRKQLPKLPHQWDAGKVTKNATVAAEGEKVYTCLLCGEKRTETLMKLPGGGQQETAKPSKKIPKKGQVFKDKTGKAKYKITRSNASGGTVEYVKPAAKKKSVTVPAAVAYNGRTYKVTAIAKNAFKNDKKLKKLVIGKNVAIIGAGAFQGCRSLAQVKIGAGLKKIGSKAFYKCGALKRMEIKSKNLKSVGKNAIKGIHKKAVIRVPGSKLKKYRKLFGAAKGFKKGMKIKK